MLNVHGASGRNIVLHSAPTPVACSIFHCRLQVRGFVLFFRRLCDRCSDLRNLITKIIIIIVDLSNDRNRRNNQNCSYPVIIGRITICLIQRWQQRDGASRGRCYRFPTPNQRHYFVCFSTQISVRSERVIPPTFCAVNNKKYPN